jgi:hypothetical protein
MRQWGRAHVGGLLSMELRPRLRVLKLPAFVPEAFFVGALGGLTKIFAVVVFGKPEKLDFMPLTQKSKFMVLATNRINLSVAAAISCLRPSACVFSTLSKTPYRPNFDSFANEFEVV